MAISIFNRMRPRILPTGNWYLRSAAHTEGGKWLRQSLGLSYREGGQSQPGFLGSILRGKWGELSTGAKIGGAVMMLPSILETFQGYRQGGATGAVKGLAKGLAWQYGMGAAWGMGKAALFNPVGGALVLGAAAIYGTKKALDIGQKRIKQARMLNMGTPAMDEFGTAATMRQRSLQAIQRSTMNARIALGSEAQLLHIPMRP